jgi:hypothetical protein
VGAQVTDDNPYNGTQAWEGDGIDIYTGFYDVSQLAELHSLGTIYGKTTADYRLSFCVNVPDSEQFQRDGYAPWRVPGMEFGVDRNPVGYIIEAKFPFASFKPEQGELFVPADGMFIPLKIDVNDNDGENDPLLPPSPSNYRSITLHWGGRDNDQNWKRPSTWGWAYVKAVTGVVGTQGQVPLTTVLRPSYPNPFNPATTVTYDLAAATHVRLAVYNALGQEIKVLVDKEQPAGRYSVRWDGTDAQGATVGTGIYLFKLVTDNYVKSHKMIYLR